MSLETTEALIKKLNNSLADGDEPIKHPAQILFSKTHPLSKHFQFEFGEVEDHVLTVTASAPASFATQSGSDRVHSSFISLFFDTVMGSTVLGELEKPQPIATIKITVNHNRPARIGEPLACKSRFERIEDEVAFVSAEIRSTETDDLLATSIGTFMIGTRSKPAKKGA